MENKITFHKSMTETYILLETRERAYRIVIDNLSGEIRREINNQVVVKFDNHITGELEFCCNMLGKYFVEFARMPLSLCKSKRYTQLFWYIMRVIEKVNTNAYNR